MNKKNIIKIINNTMIVSYVLNLSPAFAIEKDILEENQEITFSSTEEANDFFELEEGSTLNDSIDDSKLDDGVGNSNEITKDENEYFSPSINDEMLDTNDNISASDDISLTDTNIDETIALDESLKTNEIENIEVLNEKAVVDDNWVNRYVAKQIYGDELKYSQLTDDDYLKITEFNYYDYFGEAKTIPSDLFKLKNLEVLILDIQSCKDDFPKEICNLTNLTKLSLRGPLTGDLPPDLFNLTNLEYLKLKINSTGCIPDDIGNLTKLKELILSECNNLTGCIPDSVYSLTNLINICIYYCDNLSFQLSESIGNLENLTDIYICGKGITGNIPKSIGNLKNLSSLEIDETSIIGTIPDSICNLVNLGALVISSNEGLEGTIPENIGNLTNLHSLYIEGSPNISGNIPESIGNLSKAQMIGLYYNGLTGGIPDSIGKLSSVRWLAFYNNNLDGTIPETIGNMSKLEYLYLEENNLIGDIPESICSLKNIIQIDLCDNRLTGTIPIGMEDLCDKTQWYYMDLSNNQLVGTVTSKMLDDKKIYCENNFLSNAPNQAQLVFDNNSELQLDINKPVGVNDIKNKLLVLRQIDGENTYDAFSKVYNINIISDDESIFTNDLQAIKLGETEISVSIATEIDVNTNTTTSNKLKIKTIDKSAPEFTFNEIDTAWTNSNITIKGNVTDNYIFDRIVLPDGTEVEDSNFKYTVTTNGVYTFEAYDSVGNKSTEAITVGNIDIEKPIIAIEKILKEDNTVDVCIEVEDSLSGIKNVTVDGLVLKNLNKSVVNINKNGDYNIIAIDNAGNESSLKFEITEINDIIVDNENDNKPNVNKPNTDEDNSINNSDKNNSVNSIPKTGGIAGAINTICLCLLGIGSSMVFKKKNSQ